MKLKTLIAAAVAGAFALPFSVQADTPTVPGGGVAKPADSPTAPSTTHGRGAAGGSSVSGSSSASFTSVDTNNDGNISRAEWDAYHARGGAGAASGATSSDGRLGGGAATPPGAGRGMGDNTQTPGRANSATGQLPSSN